MRLLLFGPRLFGVRTGVTLGRRDLERALNFVNGQSQQPVGPALFDPDHSFIYVIKGDHNHCKFGISGNPTARLDQLRTGSAHSIEYAWIGAPEGEATAIERDAHEMLAKYRRNGEWFQVSHDAAVGAVCAAAARRNRPILGLTLEQAERIRMVAATEARNHTEFWIFRHPFAFIGGMVVVFWIAGMTAVIMYGF